MLLVLAGASAARVQPQTPDRSAANVAGCRLLKLGLGQRRAQERRSGGNEAAGDGAGHGREARLDRARGGPEPGGWLASRALPEDAPGELVDGLLVEEADRFGAEEGGTPEEDQEISLRQPAGRAGSVVVVVAQMHDDVVSDHSGQGA
ncbi:hypothetical protein [Sorangium sp. So ce128]|uniref:hypothetical protein n=1 Tax=Sorangium sp. So ce128 TaxID=3133281 RepID=UPI003F604AE7